MEPSSPIHSDVFFPLLELGHCLFVSVPAELTDTQARGLQDAVAKRLSGRRTLRGLVVDVSALNVIDSYAAKVLGDIASIAKAFGTRPVLVGIRPPVATTLVDLGIDLTHVDTALNLEQALAKLKLKLVSIEGGR